VARLRESLRAKDDEIGNAQRRLDEERARVASLQGQLAQAKAANGSSGLEKQVADLQQEAERLRQSLASKQVGARCGPARRANMASIRLVSRPGAHPAAPGGGAGAAGARGCACGAGWAGEGGAAAGQGGRPRKGREACTIVVGQ
jgi:hypothetical protein